MYKKDPFRLKVAHTWRAKPVVLLHSYDIVYMLVKTVCHGVRSNPSSAITLGPWAGQLLLAPISSSVSCVSRVPGTQYILGMTSLSSYKIQAGTKRLPRPFAVEFRLQRFVVSPNMVGQMDFRGWCQHASGVVNTAAGCCLTLAPSTIPRSHAVDA